MKYVLIGIAMLVVSFMYSYLLVKFGKITTDASTEETVEILLNTRTHLEQVLEEEGEKISSYRVNAIVSDGKVAYMEVSTNKAVGTVEKKEGITNYSMNKRELSPRASIILMTLIVFIAQVFFALMITGWRI